MDDITENFVTECLIKVQAFFEPMCRKKSAGWIDVSAADSTDGWILL